MRLYREGTPGQRAGGQGSPGGLLSTWHTVLSFMVMGLVSGLSLVSPLACHSWSGFQREGLWEVGGTYEGLVSPPLSAPPEFSQLLVAAPCSLSGPPVV